MCQPPLKFCKQPGKDHHQHQIDQCHAKQGEHSLVGAVHDALGRVQQLFAADDGNKGGILQQHDELVAQGRQHRPDGLGDDDDHHGGDVVQAQAAAGLHLARVHSHQAAPDDLGDVSAGVDAQRQRADHRKVAAVVEDDHAHDQQLHHHGVPRITVVYTWHTALKTPSTGLRRLGRCWSWATRTSATTLPSRTPMARAMAVTSRVVPTPLDVLQPAVLQDKGLIEFEEQLLPHVQPAAAFQQLAQQFVLCGHSHPHFLFVCCDLVRIL